MIIQKSPLSKLNTFLPQALQIMEAVLYVVISGTLKTVQIKFETSSAMLFLNTVNKRNLMAKALLQKLEEVGAHCGTL